MEFRKCYNILIYNINPGYQHHGVYVGDEKVVHWNSDEDTLIIHKAKSQIKMTSLKVFQGK
jgi:Lecithin retinol acyltransferase